MRNVPCLQSWELPKGPEIAGCASQAAFPGTAVVFVQLTVAALTALPNRTVKHKKIVITDALNNFILAAKLDNLPKTKLIRAHYSTETELERL